MSYNQIVNNKVDIRPVTSLSEVENAYKLVTDILSLDKHHPRDIEFYKKIFRLNSMTFSCSLFLVFGVFEKQIRHLIL